MVFSNSFSAALCCSSLVFFFPGFVIPRTSSCKRAVNDLSQPYIFATILVELRSSLCSGIFLIKTQSNKISMAIKPHGRICLFPVKILPAVSAPRTTAIGSRLLSVTWILRAFNSFVHTQVWTDGRYLCHYEWQVDPKLRTYRCIFRSS